MSLRERKGRKRYCLPSTVVECLVRDEGVAGSNPATPTSSATEALIGRSYLQTLIN